MGPVHRAFSERGLGEGQRRVQRPCKFWLLMLGQACIDVFKLTRRSEGGRLYVLWFLPNASARTNGILGFFQGFLLAK